MVTVPLIDTNSNTMSRSCTSREEVRSRADSMLHYMLLQRGSASCASSANSNLPPPLTPSSTTGSDTSPSLPYGAKARSTDRSHDPTPTPAADDRVAGNLADGAIAVPSAPTMPTSRERLRKVEQERDELRHLAQQARAQVERLKREGNSEAESTAATAQLRRLQLEREIDTVNAAAPRRSVQGLFKAACSTDLLFLIDTTSSMTPYIQAAKNQVKSIVKDIKEAFLNEADVLIAVVGYKDHGDKPNIQFLDFTPSTESVHAFLDQLAASGGGDKPEDVLGGIKQALSASWSLNTRCIVHIADAPPHGRIFGSRRDRFPKTGSEPHKLTYKPLLEQMVQLSINYALLRINKSTDLMALKFLKVYAARGAECRLLPINRCHSKVNVPISANSTLGAATRLLFAEEKLGTTYNALRQLVLKSVTASATRTAGRLSTPGLSTLYTPTSTKPSKKLESLLEIEDSAVVNVWLDRTLPSWDILSWFDETLIAEGFSPDVIHGARTLDDMMNDENNIKMSMMELKIHRRSAPFAQGAMRAAAYARTAASTNRLVVKWFKRGSKKLAHLVEGIQCQALCTAFALEFNAMVGEQYSLDFINTTCFKGTAAGDACMSLEPYICGDYVKYNNNCGYVNDVIPDDRFNQASQAFSHFTFERSRGHFLVNDLQGVGNVLTDPAIHTLDPNRFRLADTNLNEDGFKFFFAMHTCNHICQRLGLKSSAAMLMPDGPILEFRLGWRRLGTTVCCSNKLCRRIIHLSRATGSDTLPGVHWCKTCSPQLQATMTKWLCLEPDELPHEFDVSLFYYESQGRRPPRKCPRHYKEEDSGQRVAIIGDTFWSSLKFATQVGNSSRGETGESGHHRAAE